MRRSSILFPLVAGGSASLEVVASRFLTASLPGLFCLLGLLGTLAAGEELPDQPVEGTVLIDEGHAWRFFRGTQDPPADWNQPGFDDSAWETGSTGIGYGDEDDRTVLDDMRCTPVEGDKEEPTCAGGGYLAFFARAGFEAPVIPDGESLFVTVSYDDGFVLYVNGVQVGRVNMPDGPVTRETAALNVIGDAPSEPDAVIVIPAERLRAGANVLAASVHNVRLTSSDVSFIPRLIVGRPAEPEPEPGCEDLCAARAAEAFSGCIAEGLPEEECHARKKTVLEECLEAECDGEPPPDEPTCESRCKEGAAKAFELCRAEGGGADECERRSLAVLRECIAGCEDKPPEMPCADECAASGKAVFQACVEAGGDEEDCRQRADGIVQLCLERCGAGTPCEDRCAVAAQIVLTGCQLAELPEADCKAMANSVLERCVAGCEPAPSCESGCEELAKRAVEECTGRGGGEEECAAAGAAVRDECLGHCDGEPVPDCDLQCEGKAGEMFEHCVREGNPEGECAAERDAFLARCKEELGEVCKQEIAALESEFQLFERGDANRDEEVNIADAVFVLGYLFLGSQIPSCEDAADASDDGLINISDPIRILSSLFLGFGPLPEPSGHEGQDPTADGLLCRS